MISKAKPQFDPKISYRDRAAVCAWCAEQTVSAEAAALLRYLEQMWIAVAEVADVVEGNRSRHVRQQPLSFVAGVSLPRPRQF
jgi:hypothetical protein